MKQLSLLHSILDSVNNRIIEVLNRRILVNLDNKDSFFYCVLNVLDLYNLPAPALRVHYSSKNKSPSDEGSLFKMKLELQR